MFTALEILRVDVSQNTYMVLGRASGQYVKQMKMRHNVNMRDLTRLFASGGDRSAKAEDLEKEADRCGSSVCR